MCYLLLGNPDGTFLFRIILLITLESITALFYVNTGCALEEIGLHFFFGKCIFSMLLGN